MKSEFITAFALSVSAWAAPQRVAVVGAGPAGLTAARTLTELGHQLVDRQSTQLDLQRVAAEDLWLYRKWFLGALYQQQWDNYFPHVGPLFLELGFTDVIDAMKGRERTHVCRQQPHLRNRRTRRPPGAQPDPSAFRTVVGPITVPPTAGPGAAPDRCSRPRDE